ncbi:nitroreductase family protein [Micromonospora sp. CMU55-4]|uniref:nitroreductase family protein n=1 Tax=Micromonospora TaxID=1873 RepID=UPI00140949A6|nr:nitroreductase family protein [Micromonospora sp. CMU55-4]NHO83542.1 SagB/ThcOx family dehydrogenase [Micromonospora sp. CMU55-4]
MSTTWSPLLVIRPDRDAAVLEDSQSAQSVRFDAAELARKLVSDAPEVGARELSPSDDLDSISTDWVTNGWRPSLDYFNWSEQISESRREARYPARGSQAQPTRPATSTPQWNWAEEGTTAGTGGVSVGELLVRRRTARQFEPEPLSRQTVAAIFRCFSALMAPFEPSGSLAGVRMAAVVYAINGVDSGIWALDLAGERADQLTSGSFRQEMADLMCGMQAPMTASATIVLIVDFPRRQEMFPYERALRELYVEVGRVAQKFIIAAESYDCGALITPATNDNVLAELLGLSDDEAPVYTITFGRKTSRKG